MQETNVKDPRLSAYNYFHNPAIERKYTKTGPPEARGLATFYLKGTVPHAQIDTQKWCTPDQEVTAVRTLIDNHKLILVSAYVRPTAEDPNFSWIEELRTVYPDDRMVIGGDFNAHHREWGYDDDDQRGARLLEAYEKAGLELANDTHEKTRVGTSANQQDTNPDLTLVDSRIEGMEWSVFPDAWGSDHYPIEISIRIKNRAKAKKTVVTVLWDKFRALLRAQIDENDMSTKLCALLVASTREASTKKEVNWDCSTPDTHLLSLWDHRTRKLTEYRKTKDRNTLKEVNRITAEAEEYARKLRVNEWLDHCASFDQRTSIRKLWRTFRGMLGITKVRNTIENMALALDKPLEDVLEDMGKAFFPQPSTTPNAAIYTLEQAPKDPPPEQTLQKGLDTIEAFLKETGLSPSPDKTRYMIFTRKGHPTHDLTFGGLPIAQAETHKILGVFFNQRKSPKEWLTRMAKVWKQGTALVRRIAQKTGGASEEVAKTLIRAVLASKVLYGANYYKLNKSHWRAIERWQNDARRTIAGLPRHTKLEELHRCVPLPKLQDLAKDQHELHLVSLQQTRQGRAILRLLRQDVSTLPKLGRPIPPWEIADVASSTPIPRNMGLDQPERRRDYAQKHLTVVTTKLEDPTTIVLYTDAAHKDLVTTTAWHDLRQNKSWSRETKTAGTPEEAEAQAILHALEHVTQSLNSPVKTVDIYTDAQEAIRRCRKHDPNSPTTRRILALARRLESKNVKTTVHWVPGHAGVPGSEAAHRSAEALATFLLSRPRSVDSLPGTSAYSGRTGPRKQDETRDRTLYDPEDAMRKVRQDLKKRLLASLPREPDPIPLGRYSRKKMVLLRRIRTGSAVTPHDRRKWELSAGKIGRNRPPVSTASPPASPPQPQQMQRQHSLEQPEICPYCKETLSANLHHLVWECGHFTNERKKALSLLPPASRPSNLEGWARPEGDSARIALILDSLLLYLENTGLESTF
ncbi:uncharacterized protein LOC121837099 [Ixodes scapularis]|uniref:uncharacterized protein LOC121837099 n=1 Tax=Ixodes scapularis TaxID=6945 RepID=UPI001C384F40|nr:uncharacterized protein LOC121837099 [Ixodes scapularis]